MMLDANVDEYFSSLQAQLEEGVIVEDEVDLACVAMLVPLLCRVVASAAPVSTVEGTLAEVNSAVRKVLAI